jgi:hypothetical protein
MCVVTMFLRVRSAQCCCLLLRTACRLRFLELPADDGAPRHPLTDLTGLPGCTLEATQDIPACECCRGDGVKAAQQRLQPSALNCTTLCVCAKACLPNCISGYHCAGTFIDLYTGRVARASNRSKPSVNFTVEWSHGEERIIVDASKDGNLLADLLDTA